MDIGVSIWAFATQLQIGHGPKMRLGRVDNPPDTTYKINQ